MRFKVEYKTTEQHTKWIMLNNPKHHYGDPTYATVQEAEQAIAAWKRKRNNPKNVYRVTPVW